MKTYLLGHVLMDAATRQPVPDVECFQLSCGPNVRARATITMLDGRTVESEMITPQGVTTRISYEERDDPAREATILSLSAQFSDGGDLETRYAVSQQDICAARDVGGLLQGARDVVATRLARAIMSRLVVVATIPKKKEACPDCKGTGEYRGLQTVSTCTLCGGTGRV